MLRPISESIFVPAGCNMIAANADLFKTVPCFLHHISPSLVSVAKGIIYEFMANLLREVDEKTGGETAHKVVEVT